MEMNQIRSSIVTVHEIAQNLYDNTILESLQAKVAEILQLKEKLVELEMKLKIEMEANKLLSAEFAFREQEYKVEIKSLKESLELFRKGISQSVDKTNAHYYEIDVLLKTEKEKTELLTNKLAKWKNKAKFLLDQNEKLRIEIEEIRKIDAENKQYETLYKQSENQRKQGENQIKQLEIQIKQLKEKSKSTLDVKNKEIDDLKTKLKDEKSKFLAHIKDLEQEMKANVDKLNNKLNSQKNQFLDKLKDKDYQFQENKNSNENQISELNDENERLRSNIDKLSKHVRELEQKLSTNQKRLRKFELEFDLLGKNLNVPTGKASDHEFDPINDKIKELFEKAELLVKSTDENNFLRKRLNAATDEIQKKKKIEKNPKENQDDELIKSLQMSLHQTRDELEKTQAILSNYKLRNNFCKLIDHQQSQALNSFLDLHSSLFPSDQSNLRSIILTIIFGLRFPKLTKSKNRNIDPRNLLVYRGRSENSFDKKISDIRQKISDLEHEILFLKQNIEDVKSEANKNKIEKEEYSRKSYTKINYESEKQINKLKQQISHLTNELARHISPDTYKNACLNVERLEGTNKSLKEENKRLSNLLEKRNKRYDELKKKFRANILASDHQAKIYNQTKESFDDKVNEVDTLKTLLGEKNKEILALERLINKSEAKSAAATSSCACIIAENESLNNHLQCNCCQLCESQKCKELRGKYLMGTINPEFLGNYYCC